MAKLKSYLLSNFIKSFVTLFIPFFIIMSLIYIVNISKLSAKITLDFSDFGLLYAYVLPDIIFSTLPLSFLGAVINSLSNISESNEAIGVFSVGYSPNKIVKILLPTTIIFTAIVVFIAIYITPYSTQKMKNYRNKKIYESKLKILPKKLSQNFGKYHIFIDENKNGVFKNVTMFTQDSSGNTQLMLSKSGKVINDTNSSNYLNLDNGMLYRYKDSGFNIVDFKNMKLFNSSKFFYKKVVEPKEYWQRYRGKLYYYILISLSPILLLLMYISFGIYNPRYQKSRASIYIVISVLLIYIPAIVTRKLETPYMLLATLVIWSLISYVTYKNRVLKRY